MEEDRQATRLRQSFHRLSWTMTVLRRKSSTVTTRNRVCIRPDGSSLKEKEKLNKNDKFIRSINKYLEIFYN